MGSSSKTWYYAVAWGKAPGVYMTWDQCSQQVTGFPGAVFKKFSTQTEAEAFITQNQPVAAEHRHRWQHLPASSTTSTSGAAAGSNSSMNSSIHHHNHNTYIVGTNDSPIDGVQNSRKRPRTEAVVTMDTKYIDVDVDVDTTSVEEGEGNDEVTALSGMICGATPEERNHSSFYSSLGSSNSSSSSSHPPLPRATGGFSRFSSASRIRSPDDVATLTIYVDGACSQNGKGVHRAKAGYGVYYGFNDHRNAAVPLPPDELQTNNRAELHALIHALQISLRDYQAFEAKRTPLLLLWMARTERKGCQTLQAQFDFSAGGSWISLEDYRVESLPDPKQWWETEKLRRYLLARCGGVGASASDNNNNNNNNNNKPATSASPSLSMSTPSASVFEQDDVSLRTSIDLPQNAPLLDRDAQRQAFRPPVNLPQLHIYTDSKYVMEGVLSYSKSWVLRGYKLKDSNKPVLNQDLWRYLLALRDVYNTIYFTQQQFRFGHSEAPLSEPLPKLCTTFSARNDPSPEAKEGVILYHVKGHANNKGNVEADKLAVAGAARRWDRSILLKM